MMAPDDGMKGREGAPLAPRMEMAYSFFNSASLKVKRTRLFDF